MTTLKRTPLDPSSVKRIQLGNTVFEGENDVYLLDGETVALVDTGVALPTVREELAAGLAEYGLASASWPVGAEGPRSASALAGGDVRLRCRTQARLGLGARAGR